MDNLWDATRGSTLGKSAADQAERSVLPTRTGVIMARLSEFNLVPRLMEWPFGSSTGEVSSTGSRRTSRPTLGSRSSPDRAILELGGGSMWLVCWIGSCGRRWPCSIRVPGVGHNGQ